MKEKDETYNEKYDWFYQTAEWRRLRAEKFTAANGLCERCYKKDRICKGAEVHHKVPIDRNWDLRLDIDNLILLCADCHNLQHGRVSPLQRFNKFWEEVTNGGTSADDSSE